MAEETKKPLEEEKSEPKSVLDEIDFDRIKDGDEAYTQEVNQRLAKEVADASEGTDNTAPETAPAPAAEGDQKAEAPEGAQKAEQAESEEFITFDDGDPIYKGTPFKVKKAELKALVQKGRHLEVKLGELAPYVQLVQGIPTLNEMITEAAHDPKKAASLKRVAKAIREGKVDLNEPVDDFADLRVPGLHTEDVRAVAKVQQALRQREEQKRQQQEEAEQQEFQVELQRRNAEASLMVDALRTTEGETFEKVRPIMQEMIGEARKAVADGQLAPELFDGIVRGLVDPNARDEQGRPLFFNFYAEAKKRLVEKERSVAPPPVNRPNPTNNARLSPGAAGPGGRSGPASGALDWQNMSQEEFDRRMSDALSRV